MPDVPADLEAQQVRGYAVDAVAGAGVPLKISSRAPRAGWFLIRVQFIGAPNTYAPDPGWLAILRIREECHRRGYSCKRLDDLAETKTNPRRAFLVLEPQAQFPNE